MTSESAEDMSPKDQKTDLSREGNVTSTNGDKTINSNEYRVEESNFNCLFKSSWRKH